MLIDAKGAITLSMGSLTHLLAATHPTKGLGALGALQYLPHLVQAMLQESSSQVSRHQGPELRRINNSGQTQLRSQL